MDFYVNSDVPQDLSKMHATHYTDASNANYHPRLFIPLLIYLYKSTYKREATKCFL